MHFEPSRLVELMEFPPAIHKISSIQRMQDLRGRSVKADFSDLHSSVHICLARRWDLSQDKMPFFSLGLALPLTAEPVGRREIFTRSISMGTKAVALMCFSSTKTPVLFQDPCSMDVAPSPEQLMPE